MNIFSISVFAEPQQFIALSLGLFQHPLMTIAYLEKLQSRSKHVPLAITYTLEFMKAANEAELSLTLIRFISQLADVSAGVSMASSLHYVLDDSSLLTEIRHSLTHKAKANGEILSMSRRMILDQLHHKYWEMLGDKYKTVYRLQQNKINQYYYTIYHTEYTGQVCFQQMGRKDELWLAECSNYSFKQFYPLTIKAVRNGDLSIADWLQAFKLYHPDKALIAVVQVLQSYLQSGGSNFTFTAAVVKFVKQLPQSCLNQKAVVKILRKLFFVKYLSFAGHLINVLPKENQECLRRFWQSKKARFGVIYQLR